MATRPGPRRARPASTRCSRAGRQDHPSASRDTRAPRAAGAAPARPRARWRRACRKVIASHSHFGSAPHYVTAHERPRNPPAPPAGLRAGAPRLFGRSRFDVAGRRRPGRARAGSVPRRGGPQSVVSRRAVAERRRPGPALRCAAPRGGNARARRSAVSRQPHQPLLLLQIGAVDPIARGRAGSPLRHHHRRHQRRRPRRASTGPAGRGRAPVRSPLAELGWRKAAVREASRALGLPTSDAPASPCLSSRVVYGLEITPRRLRQVNNAFAGFDVNGVAPLSLAPPSAACPPSNTVRCRPSQTTDSCRRWRRLERPRRAQGTAARRFRRRLSYRTCTPASAHQSVESEAPPNPSLARVFRIGCGVPGPSPGILKMSQPVDAYVFSVTIKSWA